MAKREEWRTAKYLKKDGTMLVFPKYEVSSFGRVRSLDYNNTGKVKIMKFGEDKDGYYKIGLCVWHGQVPLKVHRLVASTFIEIPEDPKMYECINHKDEIINNNKVSNLEWCTNKYNTNYGSGIERRVKKQLNQKTTSKIVLQIDPDTNVVVAEYPSTHEAARMIGCSMKSVSNAVHTCYKLYGFYWKYK